MSSYVMIYVGVKTLKRKSGPQTVLAITKKHAQQPKLANRCVHAVGGGSGVTLTKARREQARLEHNRAARKTGAEGCCRHHVRFWRDKVLGGV